MRICSHSLCNAPLNMVEEDKESAATGSLGLVDTRRMELSITLRGMESSTYENRSKMARTRWQGRDSTNERLCSRLLG